jgi:SAM-dependent methyltransferase
VKNTYSECYNFGKENIREVEVKDKEILEVGSRIVNGSYRGIVEPMKPLTYTGIDIEKGEGVDVILDVIELPRHYSDCTFDYVICTETLEHIRLWQQAILNMKKVLKPEGNIILTTLKRWPKHDFPCDYWRFDEKVLLLAFADFELDKLELAYPAYGIGVFVKAHKPKNWDYDTGREQALMLLEARKL